MIHRNNHWTSALVFAALLLLSAATALGTGNILVNFPFDPSFVCPPNFKYAYVNVDGDYGTGFEVEPGTWIPDEVEVAVIPVNHGDMLITDNANAIFQSVQSWNCLAPETDYCSSGGGKHLIRFIDVLAPGWEYNNTATWTEAAPKQVYGRTSLIPLTCGAGYHRYFAYSGFDASGTSSLWTFPNSANALDFTFIDPVNGISELLCVTYFHESELVDLRVSNSPLFTYINLESETGDYAYLEHFDISFGYDLLNPDGMRVKVYPYWNGSECAGATMSTSLINPSGEGTGNVWFSIDSRGGTEVDQVKIEVWSADNTRKFYEEFHDVYLYFHSDEETITEIDLSHGYTGSLKYLDSVYVCFCYKLPPGGQAIVILDCKYRGETVPGLFPSGPSVYTNYIGCECEWFYVQSLKGSKEVIPMDEIELRLFNMGGDLVAQRNIPVNYSFSSFICGDANATEAVDIDDVVYLIAYIFQGGPSPNPVDSGDSNCSGNVDIDDVVYLINYIFASGPVPCDSDGDGIADCN